MTSPLPVDGPSAPPRSNGELAFAEPWESRAFAMAVMLHEAGVFTWDEFRTALVTRIATAERSGDPSSTESRDQPAHQSGQQAVQPENVVEGVAPRTGAVPAIRPPEKNFW